LSTALLYLIADENKNQSPAVPEEEEEISYIKKVTEVFKALSLGDTVVKSRMCSKDILSSMEFSVKFL
jgi:hypothetical protein